MRSSGHLLKRAGREFAKNLIWMAVVFGLLAAVLAAATDLSLVGTMAFVGVCVAVVAAIVTVVVIWSGAYDERMRLGGHDYPGSAPDRGDWPGGGWDEVGTDRTRQVGVTALADQTRDTVLDFVLDLFLVHSCEA